MDPKLDSDDQNQTGHDTTRALGGRDITASGGYLRRIGWEDKDMEWRSNEETLERWKDGCCKQQREAERVETNPGAGAWLNSP